MHHQLVAFWSDRRLGKSNLRISSVSACAVFAVLLLLPASELLANIRYVGDVHEGTPGTFPGTPAGNDAGFGTAGSDLLIGDVTGGGIFVDFNLALDNPPDFDPRQLVSASGILGVTIDGVGRVEVTDNAWILTDTSPIGSPDLVVGDIGFGLLDIQTSGLVDVGGLPFDPNNPGAPPSPGGAGSTVIGRAADGEGQVTIGSNVSRLTTGSLTVGEAGEGTIDTFFTGVLKSDVSIVGDLAGSSGTVRVNDTSRWDLRGALTVGDAGVGTIEGNGSATIRSTTTDPSILGNLDGSIGIATFNDTSQWRLSGPLTIGNGDPAATTAHGFLNINGQALVQSSDPSGITINSTGQVNLGGGTLKQLITSPIAPVVNSGVIRGDGFIDATLEITGAGELRNAAATANEREYLLFSGTVTNMGGYIESFGGEMEFLDTVTNVIGGEFVARDAIIRVVSGGLVNDGDLILGGDTIVHGAISGSGILTVLSNSIVTVVGDITFTESLLVAALNEGEVAAFLEPPSSNAINITVGNTPGTLDVIGDVTLSSSTVFDLDYSSDVSSQPGDSFQVVTAGNILGEFTNNRVVTDGRYWDISYVGDEVFVTASADLFSPTSGDFDGNGEVNGLDFLAWQRGYGSGYGAGDLANWEANYGGAPPVAAAAAVPEPSALVLALSALAFGYRRRVV